MSWLRRPISRQFIGISMPYGIATMLGITSMLKIAEVYELPRGLLYSAIISLFIIVSFLSIMETFWMLDLEEDQ